MAREVWSHSAAARLREIWLCGCVDGIGDIGGTYLSFGVCRNDNAPHRIDKVSGRPSEKYVTASAADILDIVLRQRPAPFHRYI